MTDAFNRRGVSLALLPIAAAFALASCGEAEETEQTYEAGAEDLSGGELIVEDEATPGAAPVAVPDTPMTPVPTVKGPPEGEAPPAAD
jgi:hypothetical protein